MRAVPGRNQPVDCRQPHAELLDTRTGAVWQSLLPIDRDAYDALELPRRIVKVGLGTGVMDAHYFRRSPGAVEDGPVSEREIAGHLFIHCADAPEDGPETPAGDNPTLLRVDKHHSLVFEAGREVDVIRPPDGRDYVQVIEASPQGGSLLQSSSIQHGKSGSMRPDLPRGWKLRTERFGSRTTIHLPHPTQAWFFPNGASYQGPVDTFEIRRS
ncbi:MAG: hypothetical protein JRF61_13430 [Deltaproteobacteria bacterium]|jgi:hypothetical protein|nr:hypothetical protein [Deltaproteobacteria bacterium]